MTQIAVSLSPVLNGAVTLDRPVVVTALNEVLRGPPGLSGAAQASYTHTQAIALPIWTVPHNLGRFPSVTVTDHLGQQVYPDVIYLDTNIVQVTHGLPMTGRADLI